MESGIVWEWFDKKSWVAYDSLTNQILEKAFSSGREVLQLDHGFFVNGPYNVCFKTMKQTNVKTSFVRDIRRNPGNVTSPVSTWACLVRKKWEPYDVDTSTILENAYLSGESKVILQHSFYKESGPYEVDFVDMHQKNTKTGFKREVRRIVADKADLSLKVEESTYQRRNTLVKSLKVIPSIEQDKLQPCHGNVLVFVKGIKDLPESGSWAPDPYVVVTTDFNSYVAKTEWKFKTSNPLYNQLFNIPVSKYNMSGQIFLTIYSKNHITKSNYLGRLDVSLYEVIQAVDIQDVLKLTYEARSKYKKSNGAQIDLRLQWVSKPVPAEAVISLNQILEENPTLRQQSGARLDNITKYPHSSSLILEEQLSKVEKDPEGSEEGPKSDWTPSKEILNFADSNIVEGILGNYFIEETLGEGGFAVVKRASNVETREKVAIKIVQKTIQADQEAIALIKREIKILHLIEHFSCVSFIESRETNESIYIVMEYVGGGDLLDCILSAHGFDEPQAAKVLRDVLRGLQYLHGIGVCHRDIKPENVLHHIQDDIWKIADFGCATTFTTTEPLMSEFEGLWAVHF
eukprot:TRINITY_DN6480_c0_g2_i2.p1 TRINITY_DN6480_c0_g2~~TRINITY_DN6480_c0_g2_i2.p1  ORF type:complete len:573 (+),score=109.05 TRINITY_DN6480_c0_g2_i2:289-2007(+)